MDLPFYTLGRQLILVQELEVLPSTQGKRMGFLASEFGLVHAQLLQMWGVSQQMESLFLLLSARLSRCLFNKHI